MVQDHATYHTSLLTSTWNPSHLKRTREGSDRASWLHLYSRPLTEPPYLTCWGEKTCWIWYVCFDDIFNVHLRLMDWWQSLLYRCYPTVSLGGGHWGNDDGWFFWCLSELRITTSKLLSLWREQLSQLRNFDGVESLTEGPRSSWMTDNPYQSL